MFYQVNLKGLQPSYFTEEQYDEAMQLYFYCRRFFTQCSIRRISENKMKSKIMRK